MVKMKKLLDDVGVGKKELTEGSPLHHVEHFKDGYNTAQDELGELSVSIDEDEVFNTIFNTEDSYGLLRHDVEKIAKAIKANTNIIKITKGESCKE